MAFDGICFRADGKPTGKNCDTCFEYVYKSVARDYVDTAGLQTIAAFLINPDYTLEEKMRAITEACNVKLEKAMKDKGVSKNKLKQAMKYPNGNVYKCPWDVNAYPKLTKAVLERLGETFGPLLGLDGATNLARK